MAAKTQDIESFANTDAPDVRIYTHNHHFRQLTQSGWELNNDHDVSSAIEFIDKMPWHYICEEPEISKTWAASIDWLGPLPEIRQNQTAPNPDAVRLNHLPQRVIDSILGNNEADLAIYDHALRRAQRAVGASPS